MRTYLLKICLILFISQAPIYAQKLKTDKFSISFKEIEKKEIAFCGKPKDVYEGEIKMKIKGDTISTYKFFFPMMGKTNSYLSISNKDGRIEPLLYFNEDLNAFILYPETDKEQKIFINREKTIEELILEGVEIWYNENHKTD